MIDVLAQKQKLINRFFKKADVLFTVCTHRSFNIDSMTNAMKLYGQTRHNITWCPMKGDALIDRARSRVSSYFLLERTEDIIFFCDDDVVFEVSDVLKIVDNVVSGMDICGGLVMLKKPVTMTNNYIDKNVLFKDGQEIRFGKDEKPVEIEMMGTGFMAIHRRVLEKMEKTMPLCHPDNLRFYPFFQPFPKQVNGKWNYLSEDWAFCDRAKELGFKIWLDPSIFLRHVGEYSWDLADCLRDKKKDLGAAEGLTLR